jgi:hypothetical protein
MRLAAKPKRVMTAGKRQRREIPGTDCLTIESVMIIPLFCVFLLFPVRGMLIF